MNEVHRCEYVGIPQSHSLHEKEYNKHCEDLVFVFEEIKNLSLGKRSSIAVFAFKNNHVSPEIIFNIHGGITYSSNGSKDYSIKQKNTWWFEYDCNHTEDAKDLNVIKNKELKKIYARFNKNGEIRTLDYCIEECNSLARQLKEVDILIKINKME